MLSFSQYYGEEDDTKPVFSDDGDDEFLREIAEVKDEEELDDEGASKAAQAQLERLKQQLKQKKAEIKKDVEAYYKLDYEDMVRYLFLELCVVGRLRLLL